MKASWKGWTIAAIVVALLLLAAGTVFYVMRSAEEARKAEASVVDLTPKEFGESDVEDLKREQPDAADPDAQRNYHANLAMSYFYAERYEESIKSYDAMLKYGDGDDFTVHMVVAGSYAKAGNDDKSKAVLDKARQVATAYGGNAKTEYLEQINTFAKENI